MTASHVYIHESDSGVRQVLISTSINIVPFIKPLFSALNQGHQCQRSFLKKTKKKSITLYDLRSVVVQTISESGSHVTKVTGISCCLWCVRFAYFLHHSTKGVCTIDKQNNIKQKL